MGGKNNRSGGLHNSDASILASILSESPVVVFRAEYTDAWPLVYISENISKLGYTADSLLDKQVQVKKLICGGDWVEIEKRLVDFNKTSISASNSFYLKNPDGKRYPVEMHLQLIKSQEDDKSYIQGTLQESIQQQIPARHKTKTKSTLFQVRGEEDVFYHCMNQLRDFTLQMEDIIFTIDADKRYTSIWGKWLDEAGYKQEDFVGNTAAEFLGDVGARVHDQHHQKVLRGIPTKYEFAITKNGQDYWMQSTLSPLRNSQGEIFGAIGVSRNITMFKRANERLTLQDHALQVSANAIVITDEDGKIIWANEALSTLTGYELSEVINRHTRIFKSGKQTNLFYKNLWKTIKGGKVWSGELINKRKNDTLYVEEQTITPFTDSNGKSFYIAVKQDVTNRVEREKNLHKAYKEKQTLLEEVHHRVKNNLALVSGFLELQVSRSQEHEAEILRRSQQRIHTMALIHDKLYQQDSMSGVLIHEYIERLLNDMEKVYEMPDRKIEIYLQSDPVSLNINQAIPFALICNEMITNAYLHAFKELKSGYIDVSIASDGNLVELTVHDSGIGIPDVSSRESNDSLGFTIMEQLSRQLNGKLTIESKDGTWARLIFKQEDMKGSHSYNL